MPRGRLAGPPVHDREGTLRERLAEELEDRLAELAKHGRPMTLEKLAEEMGAYKDAVIRIKNQERPVTLALLEQLAKALRMDTTTLVARVLGGEKSAQAIEAARQRLDVEVGAFIRMFTALGPEVLNDRAAMDAVRALSAIDNEDKRHEVAEIVLAVARDYERMSGARRLLVGPPSRQPQGEGGPKQKR
jgi:transcriptional regulator with XRE-family HTH domain